MKTFKYKCDICGREELAKVPSRSWESIERPDGWLSNPDWIREDDICDVCFEKIILFIEKMKGKHTI